MTTSELLIEARKLISSPDHWTQGEYARASDRTRTMPDQPNVYAFCAVGALMRADPDVYRPYDEQNPYAHATDILQRICGTLATKFNDAATHDQVMDWFDKAIEQALVEEQGED